MNAISREIFGGLMEASDVQQKVSGAISTVA